MRLPGWLARGGRARVLACWFSHRPSLLVVLAVGLAGEHVQARCVVGCGGALAVRLASKAARSMTITAIPAPHSVHSTL